MKRNNLLKRPLFLTTEIALAALLVACGGGGGGDDSASAVDSQAAAASAAEAPAADATSGEAAAADSAAASTSEDAVASAANAAPEGDGVEVEGGGDVATRAQEANAAQLAAAASEGGDQTTASAETADYRSPGDSVEESFAEPPADQPEVAAAAIEREEAQAVSGYATPRVAGLDYSGDFSSTRKALLAKHKFALVGLSSAYGITTLNRYVNDIKALNPSIKIGRYVINGEVRCTASSTHDKYPIVSAVNNANWWLRTASGAKVQWTDDFGACDLNITSWSRKNSAGQTFIQWKWAYDWNTFFKSVPKVDYVFIDAFMWRPRVTADWNRDGVNDSRDNTTIQAGMRRGHATYVNAARTTDSTLRVMGNADSDLSQTEYRELLDGAFLEGMIGRSWSPETWAGWGKALERYRAALRNTRGTNDVIFQTFASPTDYKTVRYGLATALMDNGYFMYIPSTGTMQPKWFDEFSAPIGTAVDAPPTGPAQNGIWKRRYSNGVVLVNPSKSTTASINIGSGYKRLIGAQDPSVNNGKVQSTVTLGPRQGLIMIRQ